MTTPNPSDFLTLIGAPWSAYHDHPDAETARDVASIRPAMLKRHERDVCDLYGCDSAYDHIRARQRARRDLIVQAPRMYEFIARLATTGDTEAKLILQQIHWGQS